MRAVIKFKIQNLKFRINFSIFTRQKVFIVLQMERKRHFVLLMVVWVMAVLPVFSQKDFFGFNEIEVAGETYQLKWSAKMKNGRILEEFVRAKDDLGKYEKKVVFEKSSVGKSVADEVNSDMAKLALMKEQSIVFNFNQLESDRPDEVWLEYTQGNVQGGTPFLLEWNFCRYKNVDGCVVLFRYRQRVYDTKEESFTKKVEKGREAWLSKLTSFPFPDLKEK